MNQNKMYDGEKILNDLGYIKVKYGKKVCFFDKQLKSCCYKIIFNIIDKTISKIAVTDRSKFYHVEISSQELAAISLICKGLEWI